MKAAHFIGCSGLPGSGVGTRPFSGSIGSCEGSGSSGVGWCVGAGAGAAGAGPPGAGAAGAVAPGITATPVRPAAAVPRFLQAMHRAAACRRRPEQCLLRMPVRALPAPGRGAGVSDRVRWGSCFFPSSRGRRFPGRILGFSGRRHRPELGLDRKMRRIRRRGFRARRQRLRLDRMSRHGYEGLCTPNSKSTSADAGGVCAAAGGWP